MANRRKLRQSNKEIAPDEIFLDSSNLPEFDVHQFEGRIEKPIEKHVIYIFLGAFILIALLFLWRLSVLQVVKGEAYVIRSENNRLDHKLIFQERGIILDRNGKELAWNVPGEGGVEFSYRKYIEDSGFGHMLGFVHYPAADNSGVYYRTDYEAQSGVEGYYDNVLGGAAGLRIIESDALQRVQSQNVIQPPRDGSDVTLSIDARIQHQLYETMESLAKEKDFEGGAGVIMDIRNGELLAMASFPEFDPNVLTAGEDADKIAEYNSDTRTPFLNRVTSGLYTPGSIVKPIMALAALNEGVITPNEQILSTGSISVPNPYFPDKPSVFTDWKAHGLVAMRDALAVSSNVYFYEVIGGFEDQPGIGIDLLESYVRLFGFGERSGIDIPGEVEGVIPDPAWKAEVFDGEPWRVGDTYLTAIGQYGFQITPLQAARAIAAIAADGKVVTPHLLRSNWKGGENNYQVDIPKEHFQVVKEGMRQAVTHGTAGGLNIPQVRVAAKTGTAELGVSKEKVNSWIVGFFPYDDPQYAFAVVMEKGPRDNLVGGLFVIRQLLEWMSVETPEYLNSGK